MLRVILSVVYLFAFRNNRVSQSVGFFVISLMYFIWIVTKRPFDAILRNVRDISIETAILFAHFFVTVICLVDTKYSLRYYCEIFAYLAMLLCVFIEICYLLVIYIISSIAMVKNICNLLCSDSNNSKSSLINKSRGNKLNSKKPNKVSKKKRNPHQTNKNPANKATSDPPRCLNSSSNSLHNNNHIKARENNATLLMNNFIENNEEEKVPSSKSKFSYIEQAHRNEVNKPFEIVVKRNKNSPSTVNDIPTYSKQTKNSYAKDFPLQNNISSNWINPLNKNPDRNHFQSSKDLQYSNPINYNVPNILYPTVLNQTYQVFNSFTSKEISSFSKGYNIFIRDPGSDNSKSKPLENPEPVVEQLPHSQKSFAYYVNVKGHPLPYSFGKTNKKK